jgi:hypothetical protein
MQDEAAVLIVTAHQSRRAAMNQAATSRAQQQRAAIDRGARRADGRRAHRLVVDGTDGMPSGGRGTYAKL